MPRDTKLIRSDMTQVAKEAEQYLPDLNCDDEAKVKEARERHAKAMDAFDALEVELAEAEKVEREDAERMERHQRAQDFLNRPVNAPAAPDGPATDDEARAAVEGDKSPVQRAFEDWCQHGQSMSQESRQVLVRDMQRRQSMLNDGDRSEVNRELRALTTGTESSGGALIPTDLFRSIAQILEESGPMMDGGFVRQMNTDSGNPIDLPVMTDTAGVHLVNESTGNVGTEDPRFSLVQLNAYKYATRILLVPYELLEDSAFDLESIIMGPLFGERFGRGMNAVFTNADHGADGTPKPKGVITGSTAGITTNASGNLTYDDLVKAQHALSSPYRRNATWMFPDSTLQRLRELTVGAADARPLWNADDMVNGAPATILGSPYRINPDMASFAAGALALAYGDYKQFITRRAGPYRMRRSEEFKFAEDQVAFVALARFDSDVLHDVALKINTIKT